MPSHKQQKGEGDGELGDIRGTPGWKLMVCWHKITTVKKWKQNWRSSFSDIIKQSKKIKQLYAKEHFKTGECPT